MDTAPDTRPSSAKEDTPSKVKRVNKACLNCRQRKSKCHLYATISYLLTSQPPIVNFFQHEYASRNPNRSVEATQLANLYRL
jgi:hypothetical protein